MSPLQDPLIYFHVKKSELNRFFHGERNRNTLTPLDHTGKRGRYRTSLNFKRLLTFLPTPYSSTFVYCLVKKDGLVGPFTLINLKFTKGQRNSLRVVKVII